MDRHDRHQLKSQPEGVIQMSRLHRYLEHILFTSYTQSVKSPHSLRGTIICIGRCGGMKPPKSPLNIPKTNGLNELSLNIMESYCGRNIKPSIACQKKEVILPKSHWDAVCMSVKWVGNAVNQCPCTCTCNVIEPENTSPNRTTVTNIYWSVNSIGTADLLNRS